ncbi:hypothetical protein AB0G02_33225, partial [Actinosynnema sp. NPDC023658]|uniref:hypothetical protein n=1 Tax=Actinosynnema sp. NPDC023658 TaxID=3155465 RepID=UPI00340B9122
EAGHCAISAYAPPATTNPRARAAQDGEKRAEARATAEARVRELRVRIATGTDAVWQARAAADAGKREWWAAKEAVDREIAAYNERPALTSRDVEFVDLVDAEGERVGVGFLSGQEADVARRAFTNGAGKRFTAPEDGSRRFHVAVHHDDAGYHVPLRAGGEVVLDDRAFMLLLATTRVAPPESTLTLLSCEVADAKPLRRWARGYGHRGGVEVFPDRVELTGAGGFRQLGAGDPAVPTADAVVLGRPTPVMLPAPAWAMADAARWTRVDQAMPGASALHLYAHFTNGWFFARDRWIGPAALAAELVARVEARGTAARDLDLSTPVVLMVEQLDPHGLHIKAAERFAEALRGDGAYRRVEVNTGPLLIKPGTGTVDLGAARFAKVSALRPSDVRWQPLGSGVTRHWGMALLGDDSRYPSLREAVRQVGPGSEHLMGVARADRTVEIVEVPWAASAVGDRVRPFTLYLESARGRYVVRLSDDRLLRLTAEETLKLLMGLGPFMSLVAAPVRRPLVLVTAGDEADGDLNRELLRLLYESEGYRPTGQYAGPLVEDPVLPVVLPPNGRLRLGPVASLDDVVHERGGGFRLRGSRPLGTALERVATEIRKGRWRDPRWGDREPVLVLVDSTEQHVDVALVDGGVVHLGGRAVGALHLEDDDFVAELEEGVDRPVLLIGEDAGKRPRTGGVGFDFASALRAKNHFHDVYALVGGNGRHSFRWVSQLRAGDLELTRLTRADGRPAALVARAPGDDDDVERARAWAWHSTPEGVARLLEAAGVPREQREWPPGRQPPLLLASRSAQGYLASRSDDVAVPVTGSGLAGVLAGEPAVRRMAGVDPDLPLLLAAFGHAPVEVDGFAEGMARGGYFRDVLWFDGPVEFGAPGSGDVGGGPVRVFRRLAPEPDDVVSFPLVHPVTGRVEGQFFPLERAHAVGMAAARYSEVESGVTGYVGETPLAGGAEHAGDTEVVEVVEEAYGWLAGTVPPWFLTAVHRGDRLLVRTRVGRDSSYEGDVVPLRPASAGRVLTGNRI